MTVALRVCVEFLPPGELGRPEVLRLLARHRVSPVVALHPGADEATIRALRGCADAGLEPCAWPLLDDAEGYWPSVDNVDRFVARVAAVLAEAARQGLRLPWLAIDLEPPVEGLRALTGGGHGLAERARRAAGLLSASPTGFADARAKFTALQQRLAGSGTRSLAIAWPFVSADFAGRAGSDGGAARGQAHPMQTLCGAPLDCGWDRVSIMTYGSMFAGYSRGLLSVEDARWYGYRAAARMAAALGARAGAFVGIVGQGKLGDEPSYEDPEQLRLDAMAARAAGIEDLGAYALEGILGRPAPERWLAALADSSLRRPPATIRGELLHRSIEFAGAGLGRLGRFRSAD